MENTHWINKVIIGIGTLNDFVVEYDKINTGQQFVVASNLFQQIVNGNTTGTYEFVIYYKINPNQIKLKVDNPLR